VWVVWGFGIGSRLRCVICVVSVGVVSVGRILCESRWCASRVSFSVSLLRGSSVRAL
jgi:hypothetical protein